MIPLVLQALTPSTLAEVEYIHRRSKQNSRTQKQESRTAHASLKKHRNLLDIHLCKHLYRQSASIQAQQINFR